MTLPYMDANLQNSKVLNFSLRVNLVAVWGTEQLFTDDKRLDTDDTHVEIQQPITEWKTWWFFGWNDFNDWMALYTHETMN